MGLKNIFNSVAGNLAVIGPHADIEADLMLAGKKPLTWVMVHDEDLTFNDPREQRAHEGRRKMDEAVLQGKLKSMDVTVYQARAYPYDENSEMIKLEKPWVFRHYCQPDKEADMKLFVEDNQKGFNHETSDVTFEKDIGTYLGYRDKDVKLWHEGRKPIVKASQFVANHVHAEWPRDKMLGGIRRLDNFIQRLAQNAYQQKMLHGIAKDQKKVDKQARKNPPKLR